MDCFIYKLADYCIPKDYQQAPLQLIFTIKPDGQHKARLVIGCHHIDSSACNTYSLKVKTLNLQLLQLTAAANCLSSLIASIGNAFINAYTNKKVYCIVGPEFRCLGKEGCILIVNRSVYGLKTSAEWWHSFFADTLRSLGFESTRFNRDIWMFDRGDGYGYICTHVDDFTIFA